MRGAILMVAASMILAACSTLPDSIDDCLTIECEASVLARDDRRFKARIKAVEDRRVARLCWNQGKGYNADNGRCIVILR